MAGGVLIEIRVSRRGGGSRPAYASCTALYPPCAVPSLPTSAPAERNQCRRRVPWRHLLVFFFCSSYVQVALKVQVVIAAVDACMVCSELRASWPWGIADLGRPEQGRRLVVTGRCGAADREPSRPSPPPLVFSLVRRQQPITCLRQQRLLLLSLFPDFCVARPWFTSHSPQ
jgi:hypothetical protein